MTLIGMLGLIICWSWRLSAGFQFSPVNGRVFGRAHWSRYGVSPVPPETRPLL